MIAENDNLTLAEFKANVAPSPSVPEIRSNDPSQVHYVLVRQGREFGLMRVGMIQLDKRIPRQFAAFPVAAAPHPMCPEHTYVPPAAQRPPLRSVKPMPSYLRVVA